MNLKRWGAWIALSCMFVFVLGCGPGAKKDAPPAEPEQPAAAEPTGAEPAAEQPAAAEPTDAFPAAEQPGATELAAAEPPAEPEQPPAQPDQPPAEPEQPPAEEPPGEQPDPYAIPQGATAEELVEFVKGILGQPPADEAARDKAIAAMLEATGKILEANPNEEQAEFAVTWRMRFLADTAEIEALAEELKQAGREKLARMVAGQLLSGKLRMAAFGPREDLVKLLDEVRTYLSAGPIEGPAVGLAMSAGRAAEQSGDDKLAVETYEEFAKQFGESDDPEIAGFAETFNGVARRLKLPGNPIEVEGKLLDGTPLDWAKYEGNNVVLVDFWATWCGPCVAEIPNMKELYDKYHERGFEIVGISLDRTREDLEAFVEARQIPWPIVYGDEGPSPTADYYGVMAIPTMILVGADGNVVSTKARGEALRGLLEKLLGPAEEPEGEEPEGEEPEGEEPEGEEPAPEKPE